MKKRTSRKSRNSDVQFVADSALWERLLKYTTCGQDKGGGVVPTLVLSHYVRNTTGERQAYTGLGQRDSQSTTDLPSKTC